MKKLLIIFSILILLSELIYCVNKPKSNLLIFDSLINNSVLLLKTKIESNNIDSICLQFHNHPADFYIERAISSNILKTFFIKAPSNNYPLKKILTLDIIINRISAEYFKMDNNDDLLLRKISISIAYSLIHTDRSIISLPEYSSCYSDTIRISDINIIEANQYDFAKGSIPVEEKSIFSKILEPIVVIGTAIITILLLFTVRSN